MPAGMWALSFNDKNNLFVRKIEGNHLGFLIVAVHNSDLFDSNVA